METRISLETLAGRLVAAPRLTKRVKVALESQQWRKKTVKIAKVRAVVDAGEPFDAMALTLSPLGVTAILAACEEPSPSSSSTETMDARVVELLAMVRDGRVHLALGLPSAANAGVAQCCSLPNVAHASTVVDPVPRVAAVLDLDNVDARAPPGETETTARFTFAELFAGIGGFRLGLEARGGRCVLMAEQDPWCQLTLRRNFGRDEVLASDVTQLSVDDIPAHHILTAGFPCQSFSALGARKGLDDEHTGALIWHILRIARACRPSALLLENVRGLLQIDDGETMRTIVRAIRAIGYAVDYRLIDASPLVPQHRDRVYIVAVRSDLVERLRSGSGDDGGSDGGSDSGSGGGGVTGDFAFPFPLPLPQLDRRVRDILEKECDVPARFTLEEAKWAKVSSSSYFAKFPEARLCALDGVAQTVGSSYKRGWQLYTQFVPILSTAPPAGGEKGRAFPRFFTPREVARLQGFPETFIIDGDDGSGSGTDLIEGRIYKQLGNAVSAPVIAALAESLVAFLEGKSDEACSAAGIDAARRYVAAATGAETTRHCFALVPFTHASPVAAAGTRAMPERIFRMCDRVLRIAQHNESNAVRSAEGDLGFGTIAYDAAFVLADYVERHPEIVRERSVLEIGCGSAALVSIVAALRGARIVVATDGDAELLADLATTNLRANVPTERARSVVAHALRWGSDEQANAALRRTGADASAFDVIVAADVVAVPYLDAFDALIDTFQALSDPHTVILLAYTKRHFSEETFFVKLAQRGFACIALPATEVHADFRGDAHPRLFCVQQRKSIHRDLAE